MIKNNSFSSKLFDIFNYTFLAALTLLAIYPVLYVVFASFSDNSLLMANKGLLFKPLGFSVQGYLLVFSNKMIVQGYLNTIIIVVSSITLGLLLTFFGAYAISRKSLYFRKQISLFFIFTMYFSGGLIPLYLTVKGLGMLDSMWALIIPSLLSVMNIIIMRTAFDGIPESLSESAKLDGANDFVILFRIFLPICIPTLSVIALYIGVGQWNSWFSAMIYLRTRELYPLQLILREILIQGDTSAMNSGDSMYTDLTETIKYATIMISVIPVFCVYPFIQNYFVKGVMIGAVKG